MGWNALLLSIAFFIFLISAFAETNRLPVRPARGGVGAVAGYHTEYSAMKFSLFFIAEYANMVTASALITSLFFGGWDIPFTQWDNLPPFTVLKTVLTLGAFLAKVLFFLFFFMWIRWTLPRFRYDQLMSLGWKLMLPLALAYITVVAAAVLGARPARASPAVPGTARSCSASTCVLASLLFVLPRPRPHREPRVFAARPRGRGAAARHQRARFDTWRRRTHDDRREGARPARSRR